MRVVISSGHGKLVRGASGYLDEVNEARRVVESVATWLRGQGHDVKTFHDDTSTSQNQNLNTIVNYHNAQTRDLDVSVHFNAYQTTSKPMGTECLYISQEALAARVADRIATAADLPDRGPKYRSDLFFLNNTEMPAILIETVFVDSSVDAAHYNGYYDAICSGIAEAISGQPITDTPPPPDIDPPVPIEPGSGDNRVDIQGVVHGDVTILINGSRVVGHENCEHVVDLTITLTGDVVLSINGQELHNKPGGPQANHRDIETTVFGGSSDPNNSAYAPYEFLNDTDLYVALPLRIEGTRPRVRVYHGELSAEADIMDVGPWNVDDEPYVMGRERPLAETCHDEGMPLPSGPNTGIIPTNRAGLDLSPALAKKIGLSGKGQCDWEFV